MSYSQKVNSAKSMVPPIGNKMFLEFEFEELF